MKVTITNVVSLNGGDAAILFAIVDMLRKAYGEAVDITVLDGQAKTAQRLYPDLRFETLHLPGVRNRWLRKAHRLAGAPPLPLSAGDRAVQARLAASDLIVSTGGTYLVEHYDLFGRIAHLEMAVATGRPVVLFTQSLGPFRNPAYRRRLKALLPKMRLILLRDERSRGHLQDLGLDLPQAHVVADAVFALADPATPARAPSPRPKIAVSVREWRHFAGVGADQGMEAYGGAIVAAVERLVRERNAEVTFLSTCQGVPEYRTDDSGLAARLAERLAPDVRERVVVDRGFHSPPALMERLKGFDLVVSTRMHMAILSLCVGTPVFPIAYEFKTTELFRRLGLGEWVQEIDAVEADRLSGAILRFLAGLEAVRPSLAAAVGEERRLALTAVEPLRALCA